MSIKIQQWDGSQYNYLPIAQSISSNTSLSLNGYTENDFLKSSDNYLEKVIIAEGEMSYSGSIENSGVLYPITYSKNLICLYEYFNLKTVSFYGNSKNTTSFLTIGATNLISELSTGTATTQTNVVKSNCCSLVDNWYLSSKNTFTSLNSNLVHWSGRGSSLTVIGTYSIYGLRIKNFP